MSDYLHYISDGDYNFSVSLLKEPDAISLFNDIDKYFHDLQGHLNALPELTSKDATYLIGLFMLISLRQMRNAFYLFLRRVSYDGLLLFRVGLESAVFAYRIFKDNELASVWAKKNENWPDFTAKFRRAEYPDDMPHRDDIKKYVDFINHYWAHPNIDYFSSGTEFLDRHKEENQIKLHFFDYNEEQYKLIIAWFLDVSIKIITIYRDIFQKKFPIFITSTEEDYQRLLISMEKIKKQCRLSLNEIRYPSEKLPEN